jgi:serine/threonine-protein kinase
MAGDDDREAPNTSAPEEGTTRFIDSDVVPPPARICGACGHAPVTAGAPCANCGAVQPEGGRTLVVDGRYQVESVLGRGGMGIVYLARDTGLGRLVALKMIAPRWVGDGGVVQSFQREAKALASVRSQYVVQVHAFGPHEGTLFFIMEYVRGRTLRAILNAHREHGDTIPLHRSIIILQRISQGLDAVHAAGIVHRDVKPSNIVIEEDTGRPVLVDFGLAVPSNDPAAALAMGTPQYMAPEQAGVGVAGAAVTTRTDVYSLGIVAFQMFTGRLPFDSRDVAQLVRQHARKKPPFLSSLRRDLLPFDKVVARALAKDPEERYPTCTSFAEVLAASGERWITSNLPTLPPPAPDSGIPRSTTDPTTPDAPTPEPTRERSATTAPTAIVESTSPLAASRSGRPYFALVVDDSPIFRRFTMQATQLALFRHKKDLAVVVEGAGTGEEAIQRAAAQPPDLVLLDFDMPGLDGVGTLSRLRALPGGGGARVVVLSGRVRPADRWRFAVLGVNEFVIKPIEFSQLVDRLEAIVKRAAEVGRPRPG